MELIQSLRRHAREGKTIRVGLVGAGQMGEGLACQMERMSAIRAWALADTAPHRIRDVFRSMGVESSEYVTVEDAAAASQALRDGKRIGTVNADIISRIEGIDIIVEATGIPEVGAQVALDAVLQRRHVLQMNVETDAAVGYILRKMAKAAGVVYTLSAGDEPGTAMELYDFAAGLGFEVICAGKGKNNPLDRSANPETLAATARERRMSPKMLCSFVDGTKTMVEMTSLGNAVGFVPDIRGMHGAEARPKTLPEVFVPKGSGGILESPGVVEYCRGIAPGVFVIFTTDHPKIARDLTYLSMGSGPYWALYRPYHLTSLETPVSIARAVLQGETTIATDKPPVCETVTYAKRDLKAGETIDSLGGFTVYGMIESAAAAREENLLPLGLAPGAVLVRDIASGNPITRGDVQMDTGTTIYHLRSLQDKAVARELEEP